MQSISKAIVAPTRDVILFTSKGGDTSTTSAPIKFKSFKFLVSSCWFQWNLEMIGVCGFEPTNSKLKYNDSFEQTMKWQNTSKALILNSQI